MAPIDLFFCLTAFIVAVIAQRVLLWIEGNERWRRWRMARLPLTRIADARPGARVKLQGRAEPIAGLLRAPLSDAPALAWLITLRHIASGRRQQAQREHACDFVLRDDSGMVLVRGVRAAVVCALPVATRLEVPPPSLARVLADVGVERRWLGTRFAPEVAEAVIAPDATLVVMGVVHSADGERVMSGAESAPLYVTLA
jgi:hypothetical protein